MRVRAGLESIAREKTMQRRQFGSRSGQRSSAWFVTALLLLAFLGIALVNEPESDAAAGAHTVGLYETGHDKDAGRRSE